MPSETRLTSRARKSLAVARRNQPGLARKPARKAQPSVKKNLVLLAATGSERSTSSFDVAGLAAQRLAGDLKVISVVEPVLMYGLPIEYQNELLTLDRNALEFREGQIKTLISRSHVPGVKASADVRLGQPSSEICDAARAAGASLIVVGASPHRRVRHIVTGRRAAQVLHRTDSPVLSVVPWLHSLPKKVVAAVDFGPASLFAAELAAQLLASGGTLILVHVVPLNMIFPITNPLSRKLRRKAEEDLAAIADRLGERVPSGSTVECRVLEGDPVAELLDLTANDGADLIALGTRSGSAMRRLFVGSVATDIFQSALVSVLATPPPG